MIIANPIYDVVFKRLMENERIAKFFIGTLLNQTVESVAVRPQEFTYTKELFGLAIFRLDFVAVIRTQEGELKKVLIEIQKAGKQVDLMRFRNYLAEQYKRQDTVAGQQEVLPITTIYILSFNLKNVASACLHAAREYRDLVEGQLLLQKSDFVEKLTHDSYVVQVNRIAGRFKTPLDKLLSVFEQAHFVDEQAITKDYPYETDSEELKIMTDILHHSGSNPVTRKEIEDEQEAWRSVNALFEDERKKYQQALEEKEQALEEKNQTLEEQRQLIEELKRKLAGK